MKRVPVAYGGPTTAELIAIRLKVIRETNPDAPDVRRDDVGDWWWGDVMQRSEAEIAAYLSGYILGSEAGKPS